MKRNYTEQIKRDGFVAFLKQAIYYIPNKCVIKHVEKAKLKYGLNRGEKRDRKIIVSMTSYPKRFNEKLYICLKSLLLQSVKPDKIILWLGSDATPSMVTEKMRSLEKYGVEIRFDAEENLMPHKKYYYAMREFPEDILITVDDDVVYTSDLIQSLMKTHKKYPDAVCARRVHKIVLKENDIVAPYSKWKKEYTLMRKPSELLVAIGVGGILYPPHCVDERIFDVDKLKSLCLRADDLWLKAMELLKGSSVVWAPCFFAHPPALPIDDSLWQVNVDNRGNDECFNRLMKEYDFKIQG